MDGRGIMYEGESASDIFTLGTLGCWAGFNI